MSVDTKKRLAGETLEVADALLVIWREAFGRGDIEPRDCAPMIDALLDVYCVAAEWTDKRVPVTA